MPNVKIRQCCPFRGSPLSPFPFPLVPPGKGKGGWPPASAAAGFSPGLPDYRPTGGQRAHHTRGRGQPCGLGVDAFCIANAPLGLRPGSSAARRCPVSLPCGRLSIAAVSRLPRQPCQAAKKVPCSSAGARAPALTPAAMRQVCRKANFSLKGADQYVHSHH